MTVSHINLTSGVSMFIITALILILRCPIINIKHMHTIFEQDSNQDDKDLEHYNTDQISSHP